MSKQVRIGELPLLPEVNLDMEVWPVYIRGVVSYRANVEQLAKALNEAKLKAKVEGERIIFIPEDEQEKG